MNDPKRLLDAEGDGGGGDRALYALLDAGRREAPQEAQLAAIAVKLSALGALGGGLVGGGGGGAAVGASAGAAKGSLVGATAATATKAVAVGLAAKVTAAVVVATIAVSSAVYVARTSPSRAHAPAAAPILATPIAATPRAPSPVANDLPRPIPAADPSAVATVIASATPSVNGGAPKPAAESPGAEQKLIDQALRAKGAAPERALALCGDHARRFPNGEFAEEREVIAIEALENLGRKDDAEQRARRFEAKFPGSPNIRRVHQLVDSP